LLEIVSDGTQPWRLSLSLAARESGSTSSIPADVLLSYTLFAADSYACNGRGTRVGNPVGGLTSTGRTDQRSTSASFFSGVSQGGAPIKWTDRCTRQNQHQQTLISSFTDADLHKCLLSVHPHVPPIIPRPPRLSPCPELLAPRSSPYHKMLPASASDGPTFLSTPRLSSRHGILHLITPFKPVNPTGNRPSSPNGAFIWHLGAIDEVKNASFTTVDYFTLWNYFLEVSTYVLTFQESGQWSYIFDDPSLKIRDSHQFLHSTKQRFPSFFAEKFIFH